MKTIESLAFEAVELEKKLAGYVKLRKNYRMFQDISGLITDLDLKTLAQKNKEALKGPGRTAQRLGILLGINPHYIYDAKFIMKTEPELKEFIISGKAALKDCRNILRLPPPKRKEILKKIYSGLVDREEVRKYVEKYYSPKMTKKSVDFDEVLSGLKKDLEQDITANQKFYFIGSAYNKLKASSGGNRRSEYSPAGYTDEKLADALGISRASVDRSRTFANVIDRLKVKNPQQAEDILAGRLRGALTLLSSRPNAQSYELRKHAKNQNRQG